MHTLLTWLGNRDLDNMQQDKNAAIAGFAVKANPHFDKIVILANDKKKNLGLGFESFLKKRLATIGRPNSDIRIYKAHIDSPIDYPSIAKETEKWISKLSEEADTLSINLTSGTPAMTTLSVLIAKVRLIQGFFRLHPIMN